jgi:hypothetical protein
MTSPQRAAPIPRIQRANDESGSRRGLGHRQPEADEAGEEDGERTGVGEGGPDIGSTYFVSPLDPAM